MNTILADLNYWVIIFLLVGGLYIVVAHGNMVKKLVGLSIFQTSVYLLFLSPGKVLGGTAPIVADGFEVYSNPLPHVLILTAIVVGVATIALGLALVVRIHKSYGTIEEDELHDLESDRCASSRSAGCNSASGGPALRDFAPWHDSLADRAGGQLAGLCRVDRPFDPGARRWRDFLRHGRLGAADRD
jgi:multicomponent Na+:H+ antiporter subunit C